MENQIILKMLESSEKAMSQADEKYNKLYRTNILLIKSLVFSFLISLGCITYCFYNNLNNENYTDTTFSVDGEQEAEKSEKIKQNLGVLNETKAKNENDSKSKNWSQKESSDKKN